MPASLEDRLERILGVRPVRSAPLTGGCIGEVRRIDLADGRRLVVKIGADAGARLSIEGAMLSYLAERTGLPVPAVHHASDDLLVIDFIAGASRFDTNAQRHAAELLADLHAVESPRFGFDTDTLIGGLPQPNPWTDSWIEFFGHSRLLHMADEAVRAGRLDAGARGRIARLVDRLDQLLEPPERPGLIHGDVWTTNVLADGGRITAFLDPAIYYAHPEVELAFITLFDTFGGDFFDRYQKIRGIQPGFFEHRRDLYNLYPLLVHVRLFGGGYVDAVRRILDRQGV
ncbi:MAG: fructosamine kinase [Phycisphaeraceae bacterium]|nr:MAG: fructosamine kinase [Phycisphaeraceae bacterium]